MEIFSWSPRYLIGIPAIDEQHRHLVLLVNRLGDISSGDAGADTFQQVVADITSYAEKHFTDEESSWRELGVDLSKQVAHSRMHANFVRQLHTILSQFGDTRRDAEILHGFLTAWLVHHILGEDRALARQVQANSEVTQGSEDAGGAADVLYMAVQRLYHNLSQKNDELVALNAGLEQKVAERTAELDAARLRLMVSERLASVGQLAAGVAHEINNPIGFVSSNLHTLGEYVTDLLFLLDAHIEAESECAPGSPTISHLRSIREERDLPFIREDVVRLLDDSRQGLRRVRDIVQDLRVFSRLDESSWQISDLTGGFASMANLAGKQLGPHIELKLALQQIPPVWCNAGQMNQVFMNLLINAGQAINGQGWIAVRTGYDDQSVWLEVEDNGCGISLANQKRIFEPFFTTRAVGSGFGLGLALSWSIVEQHHGRIDVRSEVELGSCFRVTLPRQGVGNG